MLSIKPEMGITITSMCFKVLPLSSRYFLKTSVFLMQFYDLNKCVVWEFHIHGMCRSACKTDTRFFFFFDACFVLKTGHGFGLTGFYWFISILLSILQVTVVEQVLTYGGGNVPTWAFSEQLRQFHGIVAVGTEGGYVYLVG